MNKQKKLTQIDLKLILQELKENPFKKFNLAFSLMVVIPFLVFLYLLVNRLFSLGILAGNIGFILFITFFISLCGFYLSYDILKSILNKVIIYAIQAKHSDQLKSTFVATVSHELKNPLSSVKINLYNIFSGVVGQINNEQKQILSVCQTIIERMHRIIQDLLNLHKIEAGMVEVNRMPCDLMDISEKQIQELGIFLDKKHIKLIKDFLGKDLFIWADKEKLAEVINNLLSNSIKFTPERGVLTLKIYPHERFARIECIDSGPGILPDKIDKLFNKFERLGAIEEGTGLGLAITKDIIEMHRGKIWVESQIGKGSKFIVVLPQDLRKVTR